MRISRSPQPNSGSIARKATVDETRLFSSVIIWGVARKALSPSGAASPRSSRARPTSLTSALRRGNCAMHR